ncbi:MAG: beta-lactamase family protein [Steroidobacteraceae bacterium]|nr:beta-lactamase family protein [Steroidobacteraceae bacterium]
MRPKVLLVLCCIALPAIAQADAGLQLVLEETLAAARERDQLPAVAALVQIDGRIEAEAALGVRALGHPEKVTLDDRWHIGSDTKAFTSTMIARLVERHVMSFDDTLATAFPSLAQDMDPAYRNVTVTQLLSHTAGLPALTDDKELPEFLAVIQTVEGVREQRAAIARNYLTTPPASKSGEFAYSNLGFILAGAIAEARTGKTWEQLIRELVFEPLGIRNTGFGVPGNAGKVDEPWGHEEVAGKLVPIDPARVDADNPLALGPAGTINIALRDWVLFAQDQLDGAHGHGKLLKPETYQTLQTPVTGNYALGWGAKLGPDGVPLLLTHSGSNGFWVADIRIMPLHNMIFLTVTNAGNEAANEAVRDIRKPLNDRLKPFE